eukprot:TRINITY_DN72998_c0_g1_i1.p1 TRINITY_DN72998_c0_g1~~TRINITY_DN72998_c0_g1_i1.p1  ORF type:complete len:414 (-),score=37.98 TRINITY_DN72998_c0_g1_i1:444-1685(-)
MTFASQRDHDDIVVDLLPGRLTFWATRRSTPAGTSGHEANEFHYFALTRDFVYEPFASDFGPLKLSMVYRYCAMLRHKLSSLALANKHLVHCCSLDENAVANEACLIGMYLVINQGFCAEDAIQPFVDAGVHMKSFCDASYQTSNFELMIVDCLRGMERAIELDWFRFRSFDINTYECYGNFDYYGLHWLIPKKVMAFAGPSDSPVNARGFKNFAPRDYIRLFREADVSLVIRLNSAEYDKREFIDNGIEHLDLYFEDGSCPKQDVIEAFMDAVNRAPGAVAVHCKAGLGRTGTLIALYAMRYYQMRAREFIGWSRLCRPGCVLGSQQQFLVDMEPLVLGSDSSPQPTSMFETNRGRDEGQGDRLCFVRQSVKCCSGSEFPSLLGRKKTFEQHGYKILHKLPVVDEDRELIFI